MPSTVKEKAKAVTIAVIYCAAGRKWHAEVCEFGETKVMRKTSDYSSKWSAYDRAAAWARLNKRGILYVTEHGPAAKQ